MRTRRSRSSSDPVSSTKHRSVLLHEAVEALNIRESDTIVDATLGGSGHAKAMVERLGPGGSFIGFDLDSDAIGRAEVSLKESVPQIQLINANFRDLKSELGKRGETSINKILFDLGWSSDQLAAGRGFSFLSDEPLLMTYSNENAHLTAATIVNEWEESSIADILFGWGEERYSRKIAKAIVLHREDKPFTTARELAEVVRAAVPRAASRGRIHPATKTFQALRIAVNDELRALDEGLKAAWKMLAPSGRISVITFHSIEDRHVKHLFADWEREGRGVRLNRKPIVPAAAEIHANPRARSAKLRVFENHLKSYVKTCTKNQ